MSNAISVNASRQVQQTSNTGGQTGGLMQRITLLQRKIEKIDQDDTLTDKQKQVQEQAIQNQIDALNAQIANIERKQEQKQQAKAMQQERELMENTMDPAAAEMAMQLQEMMKVAVASDAPALDAESSEEVVQAVEDVAQAQEDLELEPDDSLEKADISDSLATKITDTGATDESARMVTPQEELEQYLEELRENPSKAEVLKRVKEGLLVDEYR